MTPALLADGMFMDGLLYTCVAKNLADGIGTFWFPLFDQNWSNNELPYFLEQPPLGFNIMATFFRFFGDSLYVERLYSLVTYLLSTIFIVLIWKEAYYNNKTVQKNSWLPVVLWIVIPVCYWAFSNNMLECTMTVFTASAVYFFLLSERWSTLPQIIGLCISALLTLLAGLTKWFPGLFPLILPLLYWVSFRKTSFQKMVFQSLIMIGSFSVFFSLLLMNDIAFESLTLYVENRVINSIKNVATEASRLEMLVKLFWELLTIILITILVVFLLKKKQIDLKLREQRPLIIFFLLIALSASLPLMVTQEQRRFYLVTSLPYYSLGFSSIIAVGLSTYFDQLLQNKKAVLIMNSIAYVFLATALFLSFFYVGRPSRDANKLHDVYLIGQKMDRFSCIDASPKVQSDWGLKVYFWRYFNVNISGKDCNHLIILKEENSEKLVPEGYQNMDLPTKAFDIYKKLEL